MTEKTWYLFDNEKRLIYLFSIVTIIFSILLTIYGIDTLRLYHRVNSKGWTALVLALMYIPIGCIAAVFILGSKDFFTEAFRKQRGIRLFFRINITLSLLWTASVTSPYLILSAGPKIKWSEGVSIMGRQGLITAVASFAATAILITAYIIYRIFRRDRILPD